jgi:hypothetical protein
MIVKHFNFGWMEVIIAGQECFRVAATIAVTRRRFVSVAKVGVGSCLYVAIADNVKIVTTSERGTIAVVGVDGVVVVFVDRSFEWFQVVFVAE